MFDLAIYYRMVGGFIGLGPNRTQETRLRWAVTIACYMAFAALVHRESIPTILMVYLLVFAGGFLGRLIPHAVWQGQAILKNALVMALIGFVRISLIVAPYMVTDYFHPHVQYWRGLLCLFGLFQGAAYYIGNKYFDGKDAGFYFRTRSEQWRIRQMPVYPQVDMNVSTELDQGALGGSEWGELLTGWLAYQLMFISALVLL